MMTRDLLKRIKKDFGEKGIEIPYPRTHVIMDREARGS
jgi:small-conductance mechanosensitive channel